VEDSPRFQRTANRIIPTEKDPIKELNIELQSIAPERNCICQLEDAKAEKTDTLSPNSASVEDARRKATAGQEIGSNANSCSSPKVGQA